MTKTFAKLSILTALLVAAGFLGWRLTYKPNPAATTLLRGTGMDTPDPNQKGNPAYAVQRAKILMAYLQQRHFPMQDKVPRELLTLPDQELSENIEDRPSHAKPILQNFPARLTMSLCPPMESTMTHQTLTGRKSPLSAKPTCVKI